ncbi:response regulator [Candidatus Parcubacteria bacterium]|nr:response regulator [Candidatus Parcubacteria bacterium]
MDRKKNKQVKILLAEDDKFISKAYQDGLGRAGFKVITAYDGNETLKKAREEKPDVVLLDLIMPEKNGFEALEEIKADNDLKNIPIIILSNLGQDSDIQRGRDLGANDYLIKSNFSIREIIEKIKEYV